MTRQKGQTPDKTERELQLESELKQERRESSQKEHERQDRARWKEMIGHLGLSEAEAKGILDCDYL